MNTWQLDPDKAAQAFERATATQEQDFGNFFLTRLLGFEFSYTEETCEVAFEVQDFMFNPQGSLHGGVIATAMDISMGHLLRQAQGPGATLEMKLQYLAAIRGGRVRAVGRFLKRGKSVAFLESRLFDASGELAAFANATWKLIKPAP
jgi:acyl-CoA thioesterase